MAIIINFFSLYKLLHVSLTYSDPCRLPLGSLQISARDKDPSEKQTLEWLVSDMKSNTKILTKLMAKQDGG